jgi:hypothetical protein
VLLKSVDNADTDRSDLLLLDSATLETSVAVHLPERVPFGIPPQPAACQLLVRLGVLPSAHRQRDPQQLGKQ